MPTRIVDLELSQQLDPIWGLEGYDGLNILVRYHSRPLGWIYIPVRKPMISAEQLHRVITDELGWELMQTVLGEQFSNGWTGNTSLPPISVVVCTHERTNLLKLCLQALLALDYPDYEIIVVDNAPPNDNTAQLVSSLPIRYAREEQPGLSWARNRGITEARYDIVAFIDDDTRPDRGWLRAIATTFASSEVMAVTGLVVPAELETTPQIRFEYSYGLSRGLQCRTIRRESLTDQGLIWTRDFGVGTNMAFRRHLFAKIGPFDVALGVGTPSGGGDDIEMFHRLIVQGYTLVYDPAALVWHTHRRDAGSLRQWVYDNGRSFGCYLLTCARNHTVSIRSILRFAVRDWLVWWILRRPRRPGKFPRHLIALELAGALLSPLAYSQAQAQAKQVAATYPEPGADISPSKRFSHEGLQELAPRAVTDL
ncbi:MAG: glycosyltransferase [Chloroflexi bacterium]|nr:glycosyltransferase [Chloroflexota bacterium]